MTISLRPDTAADPGNGSAWLIWAPMGGKGDIMLSTVCLIAKDEQRSIAEWIAYQRVIGFDRVIVYDNDSSDGTPDIVRRIARIDPAVSLVSWPRRPGVKSQHSAYIDCLARAETEWIAFFDADEFLLLYEHSSVNAMLSSLPDDVSAVAVAWRDFGSSGRIKPGDGLVIERFLRCGPDETRPSRACKSIVRRRLIERIDNPHTMILASGRYADASGAPVTIVDKGHCTPASLSAAALNHYVLKSRTEFREKMRRGNATSRRSPCWRGSKTYRRLYWRSKDRNEAANDDILRHVDAVRSRLALYAGPHLWRRILSAIGFRLSQPRPPFAVLPQSPTSPMHGKPR